MHDKKVLVYGVKVVLIEGFDLVNVGIEVEDAELFIGIFVLLHKDSILDFLISTRLLEVPWKDDGTNQKNEVLKGHEEEKEDEEGSCVRAPEESLDAKQVIIFKHRNHA